MQYRLTLQFRDDTLGSYDTMIALEDELTKEVGESANVDGHDAGSGEIHIFIFTSDPAAAFYRLRPALERTRLFQAVTTAD